MIRNSQIGLQFNTSSQITPSIYTGTNYGIIGEALYTKDGQDVMHFEKTQGWSFTIGYRRSVFKNIFGLAYIGLTSNKRENTLAIFDDNSFIPRLGIMIGYDFMRKDKLKE